MSRTLVRYIVSTTQAERLDVGTPPLPRRATSRIAFFFTLCISIPAFAQDSPAPIAGPQRDVVFTEYSPLSRSVEVARRILSPLANVELARASAKSALRLQAINLTQETFTVYVPLKQPSRGYGVLAFIPPWQDAHLPAGWAQVLDESGMIFVSAAKSGNEENVIDRRIPLALLGAYNIMQRYPIDSDRVYIGGFSGGARVAMKVALAYPDLFHAALLNAGSDSIGDREASLPPADLFAQFQNSSRLVYVTGSEDSWNMQHDMASQASMHAWCVFGFSVETMFRAGHEIAVPYAVHRALAALDRRSVDDAGKLSACRARIAKQLATDVKHVGELLDHDKPHDAWRSLTKVDARYGGLASQEIIEFEHRIGSRR
jgi:hypothetical protein